MLGSNCSTQSAQISGKSEKVQSNLKKITSLLKGALQQLKESSRVSTNESDSSQSYTPEFINRISHNLHKEKTEMILESLEKGYVMIKHSPNAKPKEKYVYISNDRRYLCWKSLQKDDEKRIQLRKINLVLQGEEQAMCYVECKSIKSLERYLFIKSEVRSLQLEAFNVQESFKFQLQMIEAIRNAKTINLSYQV